MKRSLELCSLHRDEPKNAAQNADTALASSVVTRDVIALAGSGKQQRRFGLVSMTGFSCGLMCTWEGMLVAFLLGFQNGGSAGLIYGFFVTWLGTLSVFIVMGELSSMIPTAGGQYHWVSILAPESTRRFLSYVTGWITVVGWVAGTTAVAFFVSSLLQALLALNIPTYEAQGWQGTLLFWAILLVCVMMNTVLSKAMPAIEIAVTERLGDNIFTTFQNGGGWGSQALSFFIGLNGNAIAFVGTDGAIHMSKEVKNSTKNVARSMILSTIINGLLALGMLLAVLFCAGNVEDAVKNAPNGYPFIIIFAAGVRSNAGATAMASIVLVLELCSAAAGLAAASRMMWSFARDRGLPEHRRLSKVDRHTTVPVIAVLVVFTCAALIGLINIGSSTAFNDVVSLVLEGFYTSYFLACGMLREIREPDESDAICYTSTDGATDNLHCQWGPWRLKGLPGVANNIVACVYLILIAFFSYWPATTPVTAATMNYSSLVLGVTAIGSIVYYFTTARKTYTGPVVEVKIEQV